MAIGYLYSNKLAIVNDFSALCSAADMSSSLSITVGLRWGFNLAKCALTVAIPDGQNFRQKLQALAVLKIQIYTLSVSSIER